MLLNGGLLLFIGILCVSGLLAFLHHLATLAHPTSSNPISFLSRETENEEERKTYYEEEIEMSRKITMIEDAMAAAVGQETVAQLEEARSRPGNAFDPTGKSRWLLLGIIMFQLQSDQRGRVSTR